MFVLFVLRLQECFLQAFKSFANIVFSFICFWILGWKKNRGRGGVDLLGHWTEVWVGPGINFENLENISYFRYFMVFQGISAVVSYPLSPIHLQNKKDHNSKIKWKKITRIFQNIWTLVKSFRELGEWTKWISRLFGYFRVISRLFRSLWHVPFTDK